MIKKYLLNILTIFSLIVLISSIGFSYTPISRIRNFVNDKNNGIPITSSYMDAELNQLVTAINGTSIVQGSAPTSPTNGQLWFDTTNNVLKVLRFNEWVEMNPLHGHAVMATPQNNDLWVNNTGGQNHLKIYDINTVNWNDVPTVPRLNGVNWQIPLFSGVNWQVLTVSPGINWNSISPILINGINWDAPSLNPVANKVWTYQSFGNTPLWQQANNWVPNNIQVFTSTGTWTKPSTVGFVYVKVIGGGGTGNSHSGTTVGGGGGGGGYAEGFTAVNGNVTVTIGSTNSFAGSTTIQSTAGSAGGSTSGGAPGVGSNGSINLSGEIGYSSSTFATTLLDINGRGGNSIMGIGGRGAAGTDNSGSAGGSYGGGGGGSTNSNTGGAGNAGAVIVYY